MQSPTSVVRHTVSVLLLAAVTGCLAGNPSPPALAPAPLFDPTLFFSGRTHGEGVLHVRAGSTRMLRVDGTGRTGADGAFQLDQTVTYADGAVPWARLAETITREPTFSK